MERLLERFSDIIVEVEEHSIAKRGEIVLEKATLVLLDNTRLYIRQIRRRHEILAYSYYWIDPSGKIIEGWDNAPHHPEVETFPHHRHVGDRVEPLHDPSLEALLQQVKQKLLAANTV